MDPLIGSTLISVGGSLLGGLFGNRSAKKAAAQQRAWALEDQKMQWIRHREASEAGGFNPLATLGMGQGLAPTPVSSNNYMGEAIAQSALILGENLAKTQAANKGRQVEDLRRQRDILTRKLTNATIRPTVPGVFQRAQAFGTGGVNAGTPQNGSVPAYKLGSVDVPDPKLDRANPGYFAGLSWDAAPGFSPGQTWEDRYGDTPLNWPIALGQMSADIGYNAHKAVNYGRAALRGAGPVMTINGGEWAMEPYVPKAKRWMREYKPWQSGGYDALTGSRNPSARLQ